jgi:hypothetical protein
VSRGARRRAAAVAKRTCAAAPVRMVTDAEIEAARTERGGWTRQQLAEWGVPWPPPKGWRSALVLGCDARDKRARLRASAIMAASYAESRYAELWHRFDESKGP